MSAADPLAAASVQDIQFELLRRSAAAEYDVDALIAVWREHRHLWTGAIIDRFGVSGSGHRLRPMSMVKLRDVGTNFWNADTLYVLCPNRHAADPVAALLPGDRFAAMIDVLDAADVVDGALGGGEPGRVILRAWWD